MKTFKCVSIFFLCVFAHNVGLGQVKFAKAYGGNGYDYGYSVKQTYDNGYIIAGSTTSYGYGASDAFLVKIDSFGYQLWHREYGGINIDKAFSVQETSDSGLVVAGYTNSLGNGGYDVYVVKTNKVGDTIWTRTYGGPDWDFGFSIDVTSDGGYIVAGGTYSYGNGNEDMFLLKLDSDGDTVWTKTFGGIEEDEAKSVKQTTDGGYILTGKTKSFGDIDGDFYVVKTNSSGGLLWTKKYGGPLEDSPADIIENQNGDFVIVGGTKSYGVGAFDCYIFRLNSLGDSLWTQTYGTLNYNFATSVIETASQKLVFANTTEDSGGGLKDANIFTADMGGWYVDTKTYGSASNEETFSIAQCRDKGYVICGYTEGYSSVFSNVYVVKTDSLSFSSPFTTSLVETERVTSSLLIYPNPAQSSREVTITLDSKIGMGKSIEMVMTDVSGKVLKHSTLVIQDNLFKLGLENVDQGIYFISVNDGKTTLSHTKLIVIQ